MRHGEIFCRLKLPSPFLILPLLILSLNELFEFGFVLGLAAGARFGIHDAGGLGLADALAGIGLDGLGGGKLFWLAFGHLSGFDSEPALRSAMVLRCYAVMSSME